MGRIKVTGYFETEGDEADDSSPTGLSEEAYLEMISGETGRPLKLTDLDDVTVEKA